MKTSEISIKTLAEELKELGRIEKSSLGKKEILYIKKIRKIVLALEIMGRGLLFLGFIPAAWILGVLLLAASKIIENTELGHNLMHGQYDWAGSTDLMGNKYEFDVIAAAANWRRSHNDHHHHNTGIQGLDNDISLLRFSKEQKWRWPHLLQLPFALVSAIFSQWGVALQDMRIKDFVKREIPWTVFWDQRVKPVAKKALSKTLKDYLVFPLLAGPFFLNVFLGNLAANGLRNIWVWLVIASGHCVDGVRVYTEEEVKKAPAEHWFIRQITSSANFSSGPMLRVLTGHLGYHIEHHLYPDIPSCRYASIAPKIREICKRYDINYNSEPFTTRVKDLTYRLARFSLP